MSLCQDRHSATVAPLFLYIIHSPKNDLFQIIHFYLPRRLVVWMLNSKHLIVQMSICVFGWVCCLLRRAMVSNSVCKKSVSRSKTILHTPTFLIITIIHTKTTLIPTHIHIHILIINNVHHPKRSNTATNPYAATIHQTM